MYIPRYNSALFMLEVVDEVVVDYSAYVKAVLYRKHYGQTRKYHR